jgi:undecaprenyl-diphosphatase
MDYTQAVVLGIVQGLTEFLPVSSSGHLILVPRVFAWPDQGLAVDAAVHLGTLGALLAYFRKELFELLSGALSRRLALALVLATVPAGLAGLLFDRIIGSYLRSPLIVAAATAFWALVMAVADRLRVSRWSKWAWVEHWPSAAPRHWP